MIDQRTSGVGPRLLYLSPVVPATSGNGLAMRSGMVLRLLAAHYDISLLVVRLYAPHDTEISPEIAHLCTRSVLVPAHRSGPAGATPWLRFLARPFGHMSRRRGTGLGHQIIDEAGRAFRNESFDVVHVFRLAMLPYAQPYIDTPGRAPALHLDLDDIESTTRRRLADLYRRNGNSTMARFENMEADRAAVRERDEMQRADRLYVCSEEDQSELHRRGAGNVCVLPNALPLPDRLAPKRHSMVFTLLFVGTLGYYPNEDAMLYFCTDVLPLIRHAARRSFRVLIVGAGATPAIRKLAATPEVELVGAVPDLAPWYAEADAVIVPIRAGGGTRIKVLEAFRYGCPVVGTSIGIEGIAATAEEHVLLGDTPAALSEQCLRLMVDPGLGERLARSAATLFRQSYTFEAAAQRLAACSQLVPAADQTDAPVPSGCSSTGIRS